MLFYIAPGLTLGLLISFLYIRIRNRHTVSVAERQAEDILFAASERAQDLKDEVKEQIDDYRESLLDQLERETLPIIDNIDALEEKLQRLRDQQSANYSQEKQKVDHEDQLIKAQEEAFQKEVDKFTALQAQKETVHKSVLNRLKEKVGPEVENMTEEIRTRLIQSEKARSSKRQQLDEEFFLLDLEKKAKRTLARVLNRFQRPYCPLRGISNIVFKSDENMLRTLGKNNEHLPQLQELIGVDLTPFPEKRFLNVSGFDPVRRELARLSLEKLMREGQVNEQVIEKMVSKAKKQLFKTIRTDGNRLAKELGLRGLHPEIRNMMGALVYRYSFSQNQHFHCAEVGWLCGLLSAELGLDIYQGRRAGMLHDIGKAMDHSIDGGHAVIGAEFIAKHGEKDDIVHPVRAHHYDETPSSDLAYLVIAADAISGARPGARRSTADSYFQKMNDLERIGNSMPGVIQTYILSAGREVRVKVNSKKVDDQKSLVLSQQLAKKIEEEMAFPGTIRVTVVREINAIEYAK